VIDLFSPEFLARDDVPDVWREMRRHAPLHRHELDDGRTFLSVTRYADAVEVLGHPETFTSERGSFLHQLGSNDVAAGRMLASTDPPRHRELRRPLAVIGGRRAERFRADIDAAVRDVVDSVRHGDWDLAHSLLDLPMAVAGRVMGVPAEDWGALRDWTTMATAPDDRSVMRRTPMQTLAVGHHSLVEYFAERLAANYASDDSSLLAQLSRRERLEAELDELALTCYNVLLGANATTPHVAMGTLEVLSARGMYGCFESGDLESLVEEGLRWTSPASSFLRHAVKETTLSGGRVEQGEAVVVWIGAANRDEMVFEDAEEFRPTRAPNPHLAFGHGPHFCIGANLARMTLQKFFAEFQETFPRMRIVHAERLSSRFARGYRTFQVELEGHAQ
jgi:cytochrome P450